MRHLHCQNFFRAALTLINSQALERICVNMKFTFISLQKQLDFQKAGKYLADMYDMLLSWAEENVV